MSLITFAAGVFVGWFFLPIPASAVTLRDALIAKVPFLGAFKRDTTDSK